MARDEVSGISYVKKGNTDSRVPTPKGRFAWDILASQEFLVGTSYSDVFDLGDWGWLQLILDITASATDAGDTADIEIQFSTDGENFFPVGAFVQQAGNGAAKAEMMTFVPDLQLNPDAVFPMVAAAGVVDEKAFGRYLRAQVICTETNSVAHTLSLKAYIAHPVTDEDED